MYPLAKVRFGHLTLPRNQESLGLTPNEAAERAGESVGTFLHRLLVEERLQTGVVAFDGDWRTKEGLEQLMSHPAHMAGVGSGATGSTSGTARIPVGGGHLCDTCLTTYGTEVSSGSRTP